jgi:hypothetical protein
MSEDRDNEDRATPDQSPFAGLPRFPGGSENAKPAALPPNRARKWGIRGAIWGGIVGAVFGTIGLVTLSDDSLQAVCVFLAAPVIGAASGACTWSFRGLIWDAIKRSDDLKKQREMQERAERKQEADKEWSAVKKIMENKRRDN